VVSSVDAVFDRASVVLGSGATGAVTGVVTGVVAEGSVATGAAVPRVPRAWAMPFADAWLFGTPWVAFVWAGLSAGLPIFMVLSRGRMDVGPFNVHLVSARVEGDFRVF
jgi:hypothetical protein